MIGLYPEAPGGDPAREGEAAHWALAEAQQGRMIAEGQVAPNGWIIDEDMVDGAALFMLSVKHHLRHLAHIEERLTMAQRIHPQNWGTPDFFVIDVVERIIYLYDYKYGHGLVEAYENWQLIDYAAGILERMGLDGLQEQQWTIEMGIVQPRAWSREGHVRRWTVPLVDLRAYWNRLHASAEQAMKPGAPLQVGPHCEHCSARHACPALHKAVSHSLQTLERAAALELPDNALGFELRALYRFKELLDARISGLEVDAEARLRKGRPVPWLGLESKPGREKWTVDAATVITMGKLAGLDIAKAPLPVTPNQARKLGMIEAMITPIARRDNTAQKLVLVNQQNVRRTFIDSQFNRA